jgi:hypothetical protein
MRPALAELFFALAACGGPGVTQSSRIPSAALRARGHRAKRGEASLQITGTTRAPRPR